MKRICLPVSADYPAIFMMSPGTRHPQRAARARDAVYCEPVTGNRHALPSIH